MKTCFKCSRRLPLDEFYRHPMMGDGRLGKCKRCTRKDVRENRAKRREYYNEYDRSRDKNKTVKASIAKYPEKHRARVLLRNAVNRGKIVRGPCADCGRSKTEGHHEDYAKPLDVVWLCRLCHGKRHRMDQAAWPF